MILYEIFNRNYQVSITPQFYWDSFMWWFLFFYQNRIIYIDDKITSMRWMKTWFMLCKYSSLYKQSSNLIQKVSIILACLTFPFSTTTRWHILNLLLLEGVAWSSFLFDRCLTVQPHSELNKMGKECII